MSSNQDAHGRSLIIRAVSVGDADELAQLVNLPGFRYGTLRTPFHSIDWMRRRLENAPPGLVNIVAEMDGKIVGEAGLHRLEGRRQHVATIGMGVHDDFQGRGIGTALLTSLMDAADNWLAIRRLELTVYADNSSALHLYEKLGFKREGHLIDFAFRAGTFVDAVAMGRVLPR